MAPEYLTDYLASLRSNNTAVLDVLKDNFKIPLTHGSVVAKNIGWHLAEISRQTYILNATLQELEKELNDLPRKD